MRPRLRHITNAFLQKCEPFSIVHFLTDRCNARCPHCFLDQSHQVARKALLSLAEIKKLTTTMGRGLYNVNLTGGEPFLREDLPDILDAYCRHTPVRSVVITTNGTLLERVALFVERFRRTHYDVRVKLSFSIDQDEAEHDKLRGVPGAYRSAVGAYHVVERSGDPRLAADVVLTVTPHNFRDVSMVCEHLQTLGIRRFTPVLMRAQGCIKEVPQRAEVVAAYVGLARKLQAEDRKAWRGAPLRHRMAEAVRSAKNAIFLDAVIRGGIDADAGQHCTAGSLFGVIEANGDVVPCEPIGKQCRLGNVRDSGMDFHRLWRSKQVLSFVRSQRGTACRCTYECAWSVNLLTSLRFAPRIARAACGSFLWNR